MSSNETKRIENFPQKEITDNRKKKITICMFPASSPLERTEAIGHRKVCRSADHSFLSLELIRFVHHLIYPRTSKFVTTTIAFKRVLSIYLDGQIFSFLVRLWLSSCSPFPSTRVTRSEGISSNYSTAEWHTLRIFSVPLAMSDATRMYPVVMDGRWNGRHAHHHY